MTHQSQPVPQVTNEDVQRVVHRDFSADEFAKVIAILSEYGHEIWHREPTRVRLAALKLSDKNLDKLQVCIELAKRDYRDLVAPAECPAYCKLGWGRVDKMPAEEKSRMLDDDWRQYEEWLKRLE